MLNFNLIRWKSKGLFVPKKNLSWFSNRNGCLKKRCYQKTEVVVWEFQPPHFRRWQKMNHNILCIQMFWKDIDVCLEKWISYFIFFFPWNFDRLWTGLIIPNAKGLQVKCIWTLFLLVKGHLHLGIGNGIKGNKTNYKTPSWPHKWIQMGW